MSVIERYSEEVKQISNYDSNGVLRGLLNIFSINNPLRNKMCLLEAVSCSIDMFCKDTKALLIEKYLECNFTNIGRPTDGQSFPRLTLLVCKVNDTFHSYRVFSVTYSKEDGWVFKLNNGDIIKPFGVYGLFQRKC